MPVTITTTAYPFDELSDEAKERARDWFRNGDRDYEWWDFEDFIRVGEILGIKFNQRQKWVRPDGTAVYEASIFFSGFCSQGDGACFEGEYRFKRGAAKAIRAYAPQDEKLYDIAERLALVQQRNLFGLKATVQHTGHYYHENSVTIEVWDDRDLNRDIGERAMDEVCEALRDFMRWMYRQLEAEDTYRSSDEAVEESIEANEYLFDEEGSHVG